MDYNSIQFWLLVVQALTLVAVVVYVRTTFMLSTHTKALSALTKELVRIENQREERVKRESRQREIKEAIDLGEKFLSIDFSQFRVAVATYCQDPHPGQAAVEWCGWIRGLYQRRSRFINNDPEAISCIEFLLPVADDVLIRKSDRGKDSSLEWNFKKFRERLFIIVNAWRNELTSTPIE